MQPRPWFYFPLTTSDGKHPIVKNVDPVWMQFAGSIDLVESPGISKTVLLTSSRYSRSFPAPARVNLSLAANAPNPALYNKPFLPMAVVLEGKVESIYKNRILNDFAQKAVDSLHFQLYQSAIKPSKQIVISDGDVLANYVSRDGTKVLPLGFDRISNMTWGNRRFVLNCVDYLTDETGFINIRGKEISLRLLNLEKAKKEKLKWQVINMVGPIALLLGFGLIYSWRRRKKYA
jgi:gliding-associated putative ABC transporter substrate-binding component GldG